MNNIKLRKLYTFWSILTFIIALALQYFPGTGLILMMLGFPLLLGYFPHLIIISMVIDICRKGVSKKWLIVPAVPLIAYYTLFVYETIQILNIEKELQNENKALSINYNPAEHSIISDFFPISGYKIPVVYAENKNFSEGYVSNRIITRTYCLNADTLNAHSKTYGVKKYEFKTSLLGLLSYTTEKYKNVCRFEMPESPKGEKLKIVRIDNKQKKQKLEKSVYEIFLDEKLIGKYTDATYQKLRIFPQFFIGCGLNDSPSAWVCFAQAIREKKNLRTHPSNKLYKWPLAESLSIEAYSDDDLKSFENFNDNSDIIQLLAKHKAEVTKGLDEWGLKPDNPYKDFISTHNGYPSYEGELQGNNKARYFYNFMRENENKIVYLDIKIDKYILTSNSGFRFPDFCKVEDICENRPWHHYLFANEDGKVIKLDTFKKEGVLKGYFKVSEEIEWQYSKYELHTKIVNIPEEELRP